MGRRRPITTHRHRPFIMATERLAHWDQPAGACPDNAIPNRGQRQTEERFDEDNPVEPFRFCGPHRAVGAARRGAGATHAVSGAGRPAGSRTPSDDTRARPGEEHGGTGREPYQTTTRAIADHPGRAVAVGSVRRGHARQRPRHGSRVRAARSAVPDDERGAEYAVVRDDCRGARPAPAKAGPGLRQPLQRDARAAEKAGGPGIPRQRGAARGAIASWRERDSKMKPVSTSVPAPHFP